MLIFNKEFKNNLISNFIKIFIINNKNQLKNFNLKIIKFFKYLFY